MNTELYIRTEKLEIPTDTDMYGWKPEETGLYFVRDKFGQGIVWYDKDADCKQVIQFPPIAFNEEIYTSEIHNTIKDDLEQIKGNTDYISDVLDNYEEMITTKIGDMLNSYKSYLTEIQMAVDIAHNEVKEIKENLTRERQKQSIGVKELSDAVCDIIKAVK